MSAPVYYSKNPEVALAGQRARETFKYFWRELSWEWRRIVPAFDLVSVKAAFAEGGNVEHMWIAEIAFDGDVVRGVLLNEPDALGNIHEGDAVEIPFGERISDWMLTGSGRVLGGYSVQVLRSGMKAGERKAHDDAWGLDFGDPDHVSEPPDGEDHPMALNMADSFTKFLREHPKEIGAVDAAGATMLHREALAGNAVVVKTLLAHGASVDARDRAGRTPLALARRMGWPAIEAALLGAGARS